jgi:hypothetical protein
MAARARLMSDHKGGAMPDIEAVGDAVTGGMVAGAVEPATGPGGYTHETHCLNCGAELLGPYCSRCGQHAHVHRTLSAFFHDFLHGVLHFEGKIFRTLPLLAWRPGALTRRYIDGQRASFVSPIALFLFSVFLMFATVSLLGHGVTGLDSPQAKAGISEEIRQDQEQLAKLNARRDVALKAGKPTAKVDEQIADLKREIGGLEAVRNGDFSKTTVEAPEGLWWPLRNALSKGAKNPELLAYKLKTNAYKFSWLIIPLSVPFVWLLFPFSRRFRIYDHTVFVTYSLCFMTLLVVAGTIFTRAGVGLAAGLLWLVPPFHMYRQLKGTYGLGWFGALWRTILLTVFALMVVSLFASVLVALGGVD